MTIKDQIKAKLELARAAQEQARANQADAEVLLDQLPDAPPVEIKSVVVLRDSTNIRTAPTTAATVLAVVAAGTALNVTDANVIANGLSWYKIVGAVETTWIGGYIAQTVVGPKA